MGGWTLEASKAIYEFKATLVNIAGLSPCQKKGRGTEEGREGKSKKGRG